jgi:hypothetical protein
MVCNRKGVRNLESYKQAKLLLNSHKSSSFQVDKKPRDTHGASLLMRHKLATIFHYLSRNTVHDTDEEAPSQTIFNVRYRDTT